MDAIASLITATGLPGPPARCSPVAAHPTDFLRVWGEGGTLPQRPETDPTPADLADSDDDADTVFDILTDLAALAEPAVPALWEDPAALPHWPDAPAEAEIAGGVAVPGAAMQPSERPGQAFPGPRDDQPVLTPPSRTQGASRHQDASLEAAADRRLGAAVENRAPAAQTPDTARHHADAANQPAWSGAALPAVKGAAKEIRGLALHRALSGRSHLEMINLLSLLGPDGGGSAPGTTATDLSRTPPPATQSAIPSVPGQLIAALAARAPDHGGGFVLRLNPAELGALRLTLVPEDGSVRVEILAERAETLDLLRRNTGELAAELRALGYGGVAFSFGQEKVPRPPASKASHAGPAPERDDPPAQFVALTRGLDLRL